MIKIKTVTQEVEVVVGLKCDRCKKEINNDDWIGMQESYSIRSSGGYGSVFGDGYDIKVDLCQECLLILIGDYCQD
jgi:antitoxin CcdA